MVQQARVVESGSRQLVSDQELAREWGCHRSTVSRLLREAGVQPLYLSKKPGGTKRYRRSEIDAYLARCRPTDGLASGSRSCPPGDS